MGVEAGLETQRGDVGPQGFRPKYRDTFSLFFCSFLFLVFSIFHRFEFKFVLKFKHQLIAANKELHHEFMIYFIFCFSFLSLIFFKFKSQI